MSSIDNIDTFDIRFPTSTSLDGSDAMNPDPDYSAAYLRLGTDSGDAGHGFVFTIGRGNDVQLAAVRAVADQLRGLEVEPLLADMGGTWRRLVHDSQLRWLGPEKGVMHMAIGAVVNALWDLKAKRAEKPLWLLLSEIAADNPPADPRCTLSRRSGAAQEEGEGSAIQVEEITGGSPPAGRLTLTEIERGVLPIAAW